MSIKIYQNKSFQDVTVFDCNLFTLPKITFRAGNITPIHPDVDVPFKIRRVFYIYDIPGGADRGAHAHKKCQQFIMAAGGSFDVFLDDGKNKRTVTLNRPYYGLHVPAGIWAAEQSFSSGSVCLVMTSIKYQAADYIRDYQLFRKLKYGK